MALKLWNHPTTGEQRIYVNSEDLSRGTKVWLIELPYGFDVKHREDDAIHRAYHCTGQCGEKPWYTVARRELEKIGLTDCANWPEIVKAVESTVR